MIFSGDGKVPVGLILKGKQSQDLGMALDSVGDAAF
jgi:hypothetical protein